MNVITPILPTNKREVTLKIERARGFLEVHHSTHIEGTQLTLSEAQKILAGKPIKGVRTDDRQEYYNAIQLVRESDLDMTAWLEYFVKGLKNQMPEVRIKGEEVIKKDIIIKKIRPTGGFCFFGVK